MIIMNKDKIKIRDLLVCSLYILIPPRRRDYFNMKISNSLNPDILNPDSNYVIMNDNVPVRFVFKNYKTCKNYGTQIFDIPKELSEILKRYIEFYNLEEGDKKVQKVR